MKCSKKTTQYDYVFSSTNTGFIIKIRIKKNQISTIMSANYSKATKIKSINNTSKAT